jgi:hypothetical protein
MNDIKDRLKDLSNRLEKAFTILNLEKDRKEQRSLETESATESFWNDSDTAQEIMQRIGNLRNKL